MIEHECNNDCCCCCGDWMRDHKGMSHNHGPVCEEAYYGPKPPPEPPPDGEEV